MLQFTFTVRQHLEGTGWSIINIRNHRYVKGLSSLHKLDESISAQISCEGGSKYGTHALQH